MSENSKIFTAHVVGADGNMFPMNVYLTESDIQKIIESECNNFESDNEIHLDVTPEYVLYKYPSYTKEDLDCFYNPCPDVFTEEQYSYLPVISLINKYNWKYLRYEDAKRYVSMIDDRKPFTQNSDNMIARLIYATIQNADLSPFTDGYPESFAVNSVQYFNMRRKEELNNRKRFKDALSEISSQGGSLYSKRSDFSKVISVNLQPEALLKMQFCKGAYKNNITAYINYLILRDYEEHGDIYKEILQEQMAIEDFYRLMARFDAHDADEVAEILKLGLPKA